MKKILRYLPLLALAVIVSCTTVEEGMDRAEVLQVSTNKMDINPLGGDDTFTITSHCDWLTEVSYKGADTKWIELSSTKGSSGTKDVTIVFDENKSVDDRYATITVSNDRYNLSQSIEIHQKAGEPFILLDQSEKEVAADGEVLEIIVNSNIDYTITSSESWAQTSIDSGSKGESKISISIDNSPVIEPRSATITFLGKEHNTTATFSITQQKLVPTIELDTESVNSLAMGATSSVSVDSNISWEASCAADWVTITPTNGEKGLSNIMVKVDENAKTTVRETVVKVFNSEYNVEKQIAISQEAFGPVLDVDHESISAPVAGTTQSVSVDSSISWEASCAADWVTITPTNGAKGTSILNVEIAANTKASVRETVVKVFNTEYKVEKQITVSQDALPANTILYTSSDNKVVEPYSVAFGVSVVSNTCENGRGMIVFDAPITTIGERAFRDCTNLVSVTIPDSVTTIGSSAFDGCSRLTSVNIPDSVTTIGESAFAGCRLTSIIIPNSVTTIEHSVFYSCVSLTNVTILGGLTKIEGWVFYDCRSLTSVNIPDSVTEIRDHAFESCDSLTSIAIPESVTSIGVHAFYGCSSLTSVYISDISAWCNISLSGSFFNPFNLYLNNELVTDLTIPDSVTTIGESAFCNCDSLTSVNIHDSVTTIGEYAFCNCDSLTSVNIPDSVTTIGESAFGSCSSLTSVTIGDSVTTIGLWAFYACISLTSVYCKATTPPRGGGDMFYRHAEDFKIYVPTESVEAYKSATRWSWYADSIVGYDF